MLIARNPPTPADLERLRPLQASLKGVINAIRNGIVNLAKLVRPSRTPQKPSFHRVCEHGKPRFQLRQGEEGLSVYDARKVKPEEIVPHYRPGSVVTTRDIDFIESLGLRVKKTLGDSRLPKLLQKNHFIIIPGEDMTRNQFKKALKELEKATEEQGHEDN